LKQNYLKKHKQHIVCNLAHGFDLIKTFINHTELHSLMFSLLDESKTDTLEYNAQTSHINDLHRLVQYFNEVFITIDMTAADNDDDDNKQLQQVESINLKELRRAMREHTIQSSSSMRVILFAIYARLLNYQCRLVFAADLPPIRPRGAKEEKQLVSNENVTKNQKKKQQSQKKSVTNSNVDETSRLHCHDHSSDVSRVVSTESSALIKNHCAISPTPSASLSLPIKSQSESTMNEHHLKARYYWIELFIETSDDGYIPIDICTSTINGSRDFEATITFPILYVWAFDTDLSCTYAKDVTKRYSQKWLTTQYRTVHIEHKTNGDPKWYETLMQKYQTNDEHKSRYSAMENKHIESMLSKLSVLIANLCMLSHRFQGQLARQPIPQSKSELTGHPLYVLKSKLLKFEGIYPNDTQPVGWLKVRFLDAIISWRKFFH
jgi:hypothetical protein